MSKEIDLKIADPIVRRNFQIIIELIKNIETLLQEIEDRVEALEAP